MFYFQIAGETCISHSKLHIPNHEAMPQSDILQWCKRIKIGNMEMRNAEKRNFRQANFQCYSVAYNKVNTHFLQMLFINLQLPSKGVGPGSQEVLYGSMLE